MANWGAPKFASSCDEVITMEFERGSGTTNDIPCRAGAFWLIAASICADVRTMDDERGMVNWGAPAFGSSCDEVITIEFERGIGTTSDIPCRPVRTIEDERGKVASFCCTPAFGSSCDEVITMEFERGIGTTNDIPPVRTIDDDRGKVTSCCCIDVRTIEDERCKGPAPVANGIIGTAFASWDVRTIEDERCNVPIGAAAKDFARSNMGVGTAAGAAATGESACIFGSFGGAACIFGSFSGTFRKPFGLQRS